MTIPTTGVDPRRFEHLLDLVDHADRLTARQQAHYRRRINAERAVNAGDVRPRFKRPRHHNPNVRAQQRRWRAL